MSEEREATNSPPSNGAAGNRTRIDSSAQRGGAAKSQDEQVVKIIDLKPDMLSLCVDFICLEKKQEISKTKDGRTLHTFLVADETASCYLTLFGRDAGGPGDDVKKGHIYLMKGGMTKLFHDSVYLYLGKGGRVVRQGEFLKKFKEQPNISSPKEQTGLASEALPQQGNQEVLGAKRSRPANDTESETAPKRRIRSGSV